jgi:hypothetical protein
VVKAESLRVCRYLSSPRGQGTASSFYSSRGGGLQSCRSVLITCGGMVYISMEWVAVLANLASGGVSRRVLCPSRNGFEGSGVGAYCLVIVRTSVRGLC